ncbi:peptide deformylase [Microbispora sp. NBC_01389]|uniref:peptide deformylase n=1 Tax=Microbispora sp. NBC_01389 TaxID=2903584 RepID=UPI00324CD696
MDHGKDDAAQQAASALIAELRHWREVAGVSQKALAKLVGYTPSYISKIESGSLIPSREFVESADEHLRTGNALLRRWKALRDAGAENRGERHQGSISGDDPQAAPGNSLIVEHEKAELAFRDGMFKTCIRRHLQNAGNEPVTQYLIRIAVDRYPGDPERSNRLYREFPLTWEEIGLSAVCQGEPMTWRAKHDRDAFKEVWLLFENGDERFPLYPGQSTWIEYVYTVSADKWGPWWTRAIRLPTKRLSMTLDFPAEMQPSVWGIETSMTAEASPFKTPINRANSSDRVIFSWSADSPPLHARYRIEWKFKNEIAREVDAMKTLAPSERMQSLGIAQEGETVLYEVSRRFDLPTEAEDARRVVSQLVSTMERVAQAHTFAKGMGVAAPQIGISRAVAVVRTPDGETITLINPRIIDESTEMDEQYEGCLSFFDVRGMVPRPVCIEVEHQDVDGNTHITMFDGPISRLVNHEIDHLFGQLYRAKMRPGVEPIPVSQYKGTGQPWTQGRT